MAQAYAAAAWNGIGTSGQTNLAKKMEAREKRREEHAQAKVSAPVNPQAVNVIGRMNPAKFPTRRNNWVTGF
jgi:hypothetical protein